MASFSQIIRLISHFSNLLFVYCLRFAFSMLLLKILKLTAEMLNVTIFLGDGCFKSLVLLIVDVNRHLYFLFCVDFVFLIEINYLFLFDFCSFQLLFHFRDGNVEAILLFFWVIFVFHQNNFNFLFQLRDFFTFFAQNILNLSSQVLIVSLKGIQMVY